MDRFHDRYADFKKALERLDEVFDIEKNDIVRDACIQRFEFTYELAWKTLKHFLRTKDIDVRNPKDTLKEAYSQGLIDEPELWGKFQEQRNLTSHTYDESLADEVYNFIKDIGLQLFHQLDKTIQKQL